MKIRIIEVDDEKNLAKLFVTCFSAPPWNEAWTLPTALSRIRPMVRTESFCGVIALREDEAAGMAFGQIEQWTDSCHFLLQEMCVVPDLQGQGIGTAMLGTLGKQLKENAGVTSMYLLTDETAPAAKFYGKLHFARSQTKILMGSPINRIIEAAAHNSLLNTDAQGRWST